MALPSARAGRCVWWIGLALLGAMILVVPAQGTTLSDPSTDILDPIDPSTDILDLISSGSGSAEQRAQPDSPTAAPTIGFVDTATAATPEGRQALIDGIADSGATKVTVVQVSGIVSELSCADGSRAENFSSLNAAAVEGTLATGVAHDSIVSVSTTATCDTTVRRTRRQIITSTFSFATEIILSEAVADAVVASLVQAANDNTLDYSAVRLIDATGAVVTAAIVTTTSGVSVTIPLTTLSDPSTDILNLISCPAECLAHDHDGDGDLDHLVVSKGKKAKGKTTVASVDCSTCPVDSLATAGKAKKAKKAKKDKGVKKAKKAKKGKRGRLSHTLGLDGGLGAGVLSSAILFAAAIGAIMYARSKARQQLQTTATPNEDQRPPDASDPLLAIGCNAKGGAGLRV